MPASKYDFSIEQGSSFRLSIIYKDDNNNIVNLTNYCARLTWKDSNGNIKIFSTTNIDDNDYHFTIDGPNGQILLLISSDTTNNYDFTTAKYDLEIQSPDDLYVAGGKQTLRILYGTIKLNKRFSQTTTTMDCII
jgi:hypothetical protein